MKLDYRIIDKLVKTRVVSGINLSVYCVVYLGESTLLLSIANNVYLHSQRSSNRTNECAL